MANPSSTSSKRLVGLGLRGMRNSIQAPPTQVTAQIKSALAQSSPRTSPTVNFVPTGSMVTATPPGGLTRTTTTSPSGTSMRTSPSMMTITSITHPNAAQHPGIVGGNSTSMARTPTSPIGIKTFGGGSATTSPTLLSRSATMTSPFGTPTSTPFVTPNTSPQMKVATAGQVANVVAGSVNTSGGVERGGNLLVESGSAIPGDTNQKIPFVNAGARSAKSPYGEFRNGADEYFGPMKRLEEIVNEISEMREGGREGEGSSRHTEDAKGQRVPHSPELQGSPMFLDVPFPLHPGKTFRIHSSPTTGSELITNGHPDINSHPESTIPQQSPLATSSTGRVVSNATITGPSMPSPTGKSRKVLSTDNPIFSPKTSNTPPDTRPDNFFERSTNSAIGPSSSAGSTKPRKIRFSPSPSPSSTSYYSPIHPISSPRSSPSSNYSRMSGGDLSDYRSFPASSPLAKRSKSNFEGQLMSSPPPSPSSSLSRWLREGYEENYSTICSPSSTPLLAGDGEGGRGLRSRTVSIASTSQDGSCVDLGSYSSVNSLSPKKRFGLNSPVAKIETVLGPRERGIGCIPEKRDYHSLHSRLRSGSLSPGALTPLEENESMDFSFVGAERIQDAADTDPLHFNSPAPSPTSLSPSPSPSIANSSPISGMPVVTSSDTVVVANAAVGILSGAGTGTAAVAAAAAAATTPPRLGLRRKSTGVGSPLVNVVATYDSIKNEQGKDDIGGKRIEENKAGEYDDADIGDTQMSPVLMRTKDSLLLKDMQKQKKKRKNTIKAGMMTTSIMEKSDLGIPASNSAPVDSDIGWLTIPDELRFLVDTGMKTRGLRSLHVGEIHPPSPPSRSPECVYAADYLAELPRLLRSPTQVSIPDTPTIGPCTTTVSGSIPADESISPLQLSSPILPSAACS